MIAVRDARAGDESFVVSTWSASFKTSHSAGLIQSEDWATVMHEQIAKVLARAGARTLVAYERTDPSFLYGFIAGDTTDARMPVVFYVYVKEPYREAGWENGKRIGDGYARQLFRALGVDPARPFVYVCKTPIVSRLAGKIPMARWNPLVARYPQHPR